MALSEARDPTARLTLLQAPPPVRKTRRHSWIAILFMLWVVVPTGVSGWYLYVVAADQFASTVGFSVRKE